MPNNVEYKNTVKDFTKDAESKLKGVNTSPFSASALSILKAKISQYLSELIDESIKVSKRHRDDTVSAAHVERASEYLFSSTTRRFFRHFGHDRRYFTWCFYIKYFSYDDCREIFYTWHTGIGGIKYNWCIFDSFSLCKRLIGKRFAQVGLGKRYHLSTPHSAIFMAT